MLKIKHKAYITKTDENGATYVMVEDRKVVLDKVMKGKFINKLSSYIHLGSYRINLEDKAYPNTYFNLLNLKEDGYGCYVTFETNHPDLISKMNSFVPGNFNVKRLGNATISYGEFWDKINSTKFVAVSRILFKKRLTKKRLIVLGMMYNNL